MNPKGETSHLCRFVDEPLPYTKEKEKEGLRELKASNSKAKLNRIEQTDGEKTGLINNSITGLINSADNLPEMRELLDWCELVPESCTGRSMQYFGG